MTSIALPDNSVAQGSVEKLIQDAVSAAAAKHLAESAGLLAVDGLNVLNSVTARTPPA